MAKSLVVPPELKILSSTNETFQFTPATPTPLLPEAPMVPDT